MALVPNSAGATQELGITWARVIAIWWLILWRAVIGGLVLGLVASLIVGFGGGVLGLSDDILQWMGTGIGVISNVVWYVFAVRMALEKSYRDFRIALVPNLGF